MQAKLALPLVLLVCVCGCTNKPNIEAARSASAQVRDAVASKDTVKLKSSLTDDVIVVRDNGPALVGPDAIASYATAIKLKNNDIVLSSEVVEPAGDVVVDRGQFAAKSASAGGPAVATGNYVHLLRLQSDGSWKVWRGVWTFGPVTADTAKCCDGVGIGAKCVDQPTSGGCPADTPILVLQP